MTSTRRDVGDPLGNAFDKIAVRIDQRKPVTGLQVLDGHSLEQR
jgi:hypothetical protein